MPKLNLKRTPEEEAARELRKKEKKAKKRRRKHDDDDLPSQKRRRSSPLDSTTHNGRKWASDDEDDVDYPGPYPAESSSRAHEHDFYSEASKPDYETIRAEMEEQRFREKLSTAFDEDEGFDSLEARFNSFAHVPGHWGGAGSSRNTIKPDFDSEHFMKIDPMNLDEEDYIEWIRRGMYRKTHAHEFEEQERKKSEHASRRAREKAIEDETKRLEREAQAERTRKKRDKETRKRRQTVEEYHERWQKLSSVKTDSTQADLRFGDVPWPVFTGSKDSRTTLDDLSKDAVSSFLFSWNVAPTDEAVSEEKKARKDRLRETYLRFHPDKFEGRFMSRVHPSDKEKVKMGLASVVRILNDLMTEN